MFSTLNNDRFWQFSIVKAERWFVCLRFSYKALSDSKFTFDGSFVAPVVFALMGVTDLLDQHICKASGG